LVILAGLVGVSTILGSNGLLRLIDLHQQTRTMSDRAFALMEENAARRDRILRLHGDDLLLETLARRQLGLVRTGEIVYRFAGPEDGRRSVPAPSAP
jgi:cell division protein FtsB